MMKKLTMMPKAVHQKRTPTVTVKFLQNGDHKVKAQSGRGEILALIANIFDITPQKYKIHPKSML